MKLNPKRFAIAAAALTLVAPFAATAASADPGQYGQGYGYSDHRDNHRNDDRNSYGQRGNDNRGSYQNNRYQGQNWGQNNWRRGDRYDQGRYANFDWRREHYREPPRGYRYVRDDRGDVLLVGLLSGVILSQVFSHNGY